MKRRKGKPRKAVAPENAGELKVVELEVSGEGARPLSADEHLAVSLGRLVRGLEDARRRLDAGTATDDDRREVQWMLRSAEPMHQPTEPGYPPAITYALRNDKRLQGRFRAGRAAWVQAVAGNHDERFWSLTLSEFERALDRITRTKRGRPPIIEAAAAVVIAAGISGWEITSLVTEASKIKAAAASE